MTDMQLAQSLVDRAEKMFPGEMGPRAGQKKHKYCEDLLNCYQEMTGKRLELKAEVRYKNGLEWKEGMGLRDSIVLDLYNRNTKLPLDYKFGDAKVTARQRTQYQAQLPEGSQPIIEIKPKKPDAKSTDVKPKVKESKNSKTTDEKSKFKDKTSEIKDLEK